MEQAEHVGIIDEENGWVVEMLHPGVTVVRFKTFPYPWSLREMFKRAPLVHTLLMPRATRLQIEESAAHKNIFAEHPVRLASSELTGKKRVGFKMGSYKERQKFMLSLDTDRQELFDELLAFNFIEAEITHRYFCLGGEEYLPPKDVAKIFGCSQGGLQVWVGMVLYYLDSPLEVPKQSIDFVPGLEKQVRCERERLQDIEVQKQELAKHGLKKVPMGMSLRCIEDYALVYRAWQIDELSEMTVAESERAVLVARYGLEDNVFKTLEEIGAKRGITRERVRQVEGVALRKLRRLERKQE